jgi:hypothetical protein
MDKEIAEKDEEIADLKLEIADLRWQLRGNKRGRYEDDDHVDIDGRSAKRSREYY